MRRGWWLGWAALAACDPGGASVVPGDDSAEDTPETEDSDAADSDDGPPVEPEGPEIAAGPVVSAWVAAVPNLDDDDGDAQIDFLGPISVLDDDAAPLRIQPSTNGVQAELTTIRLRMEGAGAEFRVARGAEVLLDGARAEWTEAWSADMLDLTVQVRLTLAEAALVVEELDAEGAVAATARVKLWGAPLLLNHHLQPAEAVWAVEVNGVLGDNAAFIEGFEAALGSSFEAVAGRRYNGDVWFQDELEWSTSTAPGQRIDVVIDSIRDRGLDDWAEDNIVGADQLPVVFGTGRASSQDSFGNLEVSPPVTVGGVPYPFGRIYYGANGARFGPAQGLRDALASQVVQAPFEIDTSWLCVGHVDEFMAFIPDPAAPKGFWLVWSDVDLAYDLLDRLDGDTRLPRYAPAFGGHGIRDVKELRDDAALRAYNEDVRDQDLEPILVQVLEELGLDPGDVLRIPALFEAAPGCSGAAAALIPGMVNLTVANIPGEPVKLLMADPFLRADVADQGSDPLIADMRARFPAGVELVFVDDWDTYHMALGEVHCGSNVRRTPVDGWWLSALHLLGRTP